MYPNGQPVGTNAVGPGDELLFQLTLVYTRLAPDEQVYAAFQGGRMLVQIASGTGDATPPGGIPLMGGEGGEGCNGTNSFKSLLMPYSVTVADVILGYIPVAGIYTNGDAHIGANDGIGGVHASTSLQVAVRGNMTAPSTNCLVTCLVAPATNRVCQGRSATFALTATNGAAPYRIVWSGPGDFLSTNASITISNTQPNNAGLYSATVTDSNDCTTVCEALLIVDALPVCFIAPGATSICVGGSGTFTASVPPESGPVTFSWTGPGEFFSTNQTITVSNAGTYVAAVMDANGCSSTCNATLTVNPNPTCVVVPVDTNVCFGGCVEIRVTATNGLAPYTITLQHGLDPPLATNVTSSGATFTICPPDLGTNSYAVTVTDANGCLGSGASRIVIYPAPVCAVEPSSNTVCAGSVATFAVQAQGVGPFALQWSGPDGFASTNQVVSITNAQNASAGIYSASVRDANGCTTVCQARLIVNANPVCAVTPATNDICLSGSASFTANASLGTPPYRYSWTGPGGFVTTNQTILISNAQPSQAGTYRSTVTDANGCTTTCAAELLVDNPLCAVTPSVPSVCVGSCLDLTVRPFGGFAPYRVVVTGPNGFTFTNVIMSNVTVSVCVPALGPNVYLAQITDAKGCTTTCQTSITGNAPIAGPAIVCPQAVNTYSVARTNGNRLYEWRLLQNNSAARIVASSGPSVQVYSGTNGSYLLHLDVRAGEALVESCDHLSTIADTLPPVITCGDSLIVNENPRSGGFAVVNFAAPTVTDNCDTNPVVTCVPASGSSFAVGQTTVNCTATDDLANTATCSFNIKVVPFVIIVVTSAGDSGPGTLRQALNDANATPGLNIIQFQLPGAPPQTIRPLTPLPAVIEPVRIEASAVGTNAPAVVLDGSLTQAGVAGSYGLLLMSRSNLVRGLIINRFGTGIRVEGEGGNRIEANWIGTDATGFVPAPNMGSGISIRSSDNVVAANVISGNAGDGTRLDGVGARNNQISGNRIGIGADGVTPLGNGGAGVRLVSGANGNRVGGTLRGLGNSIGFNANLGIVLEGSAGTANRISGNSIGANNGLEIDLGDNGPTPNDPLDADAGPNGYQNFPIITAARSDTIESTIVEGVFAGAASRTFQLEFFLQPSGPLSNFQEGQIFLGVKSVTTDNSGNAVFTAEFLIPATKEHSVVATATDAAGSTSEFSPAFPVQTPPETALQPSSTTVPNGGTVTLCVEVTGIGPFTYQWRREGRNIPGETNRCITITNFDLRVAGTYMVAVGNDAGAVLSASSLLLISDGPRLQGADMFAGRLLVIGSNGVALGSNIGATGEAGEPEHFSRPPSRSIWYTWTPPGTGIATFRTTGSTFDTLLAVYVGASLGDLLEVAADDDRGGFLSSEVHFNAREGTNYHIVVDGFGAADGDTVLSWEFEATPRLLPVILQHPRSVTVAPGGLAMFTVDAVSGCNDGHHDCRHYHDHSPGHTNEPIILDYQWFFNGTAIPGATNTNYVVFSVSDEFVGDYTVQVSKFGRMVESRSASLQINVTGEEVQNAFAADKVLSALDTPILLGGFITPPPGPPPEGPIEPPAQAFSAASTVVRGYTGTQVFNTGNGGTEPNDQPICGVIGGASVWVTFVPQDTGLLHLNTDGSSYNTVMGVFVRSAINPAILQLIDCDNNSGLDGRDSALNLPVISGATNFVMVDGVNGATGTLKLNYSLVTASTMISLGRNAQGHVTVRIVGHPGMRFRLEESVDFTDWEPLITTNSASGIFDFIDTGSQLQSSRAYRAVMLP